jgi:predicted metalloprotease with PDZ domain
MHYSLSIPNAEKHFLHIEIKVETPHNSCLLQLPAWRPGRYELGNFAKNVKGFMAYNEQNKPIAFKKTSKDLWQIDTDNCNSIKVHYQYYANELNAGSTFLNEEQLYVNPVNCLMYQSGKEEQECSLSLNIPSTYKVAGSLKSNAEGIFSFASYHQLADTPFICSASLQHHVFSFNDVAFHLWFQGECEADFYKIQKDILAYTKVQLAAMGDFPFDEFHYLFQIAPYKAYHGVEHLKSTVLFLGPGCDLMKKYIYDDLMGVCSHELYHVWNIKSIRPTEMMPYDYARENYTTLGFVAEGITTYYGDLFLGRSEYFSMEEYLNELAAQFQKHKDNAGRFNYSVAESSFDTWLDGYAPGIPGRKISIYFDGCLLAFIADTYIRKFSSNTKSLDNVMKRLYNEFAKNALGYTASDYLRIVEEEADAPLPELQHLLFVAQDYEKHFKQALGYYGLLLTQLPSPIFYENTFGFRAIEGNTKVTHIYPDSPAYHSNLAEGDEIMTVNGIAVQAQDLDKQIEYFSKKDKKNTLLVKTLLGTKEVLLTMSNEAKHFYPRYQIGISDNENENLMAWLSKE